VIPNPVTNEVAEKRLLAVTSLNVLGFRSLLSRIQHSALGFSIEVTMKPLDVSQPKSGLRSAFFRNRILNKKRSSIFNWDLRKDAQKNLTIGIRGLKRGVTNDEDPGFRHNQSFFKAWMIVSTLKPT
jgi:hypothetical protein